MTYPQPAMYRPKYSKLSYPVMVLGERQMFGRTEYQIQGIGAHSGTAWITKGINHTQLVFDSEEG